MEESRLYADFERVDVMLTTLRRVLDIGVIFNAEAKSDNDDNAALMEMMEQYVDDIRAQLSDAIIGVMQNEKIPA